MLAVLLLILAVYQFCHVTSEMSDAVLQCVVLCNVSVLCSHVS